MKAVYTIVLLIISNIFMTFAWYGHLKLKDFSWFSNLGLPLIILFSWGLIILVYPVDETVPLDVIDIAAGDDTHIVH